MTNILPNGLDADVLKEWEETAVAAARQYAAEHPGAELKEIVVAGAKAATDHVTRQVRGENPLYNPAAADYAAGRADQLSRHVDVDLALASEAYRQGQQDERTAAVDAELLALAELGRTLLGGAAGDEQ
jgi:hypothetical protein